MAAHALRNVPLLEHLDDEELATLTERCSRRTYATDEVLWRAGDQAEELLIVETGELEVLGRDAAGTEEVIARLGPGECVGELALLLDEQRSATVTCSVAASVTVLPKDAFHDVVRDPRALARVSEVVSRRAIAVTQRRPIAQRMQVVGVVAERGVVGTSLVAGAIAALADARLGRRAVLLTPDDGAELEVVANRCRVDHADAHVVVIDLRASVGIDRALAACDRVVHLVALPNEPTHRRVLTVVNEHGVASSAIDRDRCDPFVLRHEPALDGVPVQAAIARVVDDSSMQATATLERLVRKIFGVTIGVAFGGGAAFGIAHVGILQALEAAGIVPDLYAGTSMGAIVAIGGAAGLSGDDMAAIAARHGNVRTTMSVLDPTVTGTGLLAGRRLVKIFSPMLALDRFDELVRPCRVVATDIDTGERVELGTGRLDTAFRASCSIPLIFTPVTIGARTLVDGAMVDPVPTEVVRGMGADIVIGVNVVPRLERGTTTALSRLFKRVTALNPLLARRGAAGMPDILDVLMNSLQVVQRELGSYRSLSADVSVDVDLAGFTWIEFYRASEIVERGRLAGEDAVAAVQAAIAARLDGGQTAAAASSSAATSVATSAASDDTSGSTSGQAMNPTPTRSR